MKRTRTTYDGWGIVIVDSPKVPQPSRNFTGRYWWFGHPPSPPGAHLAGHVINVFKTRREARMAAIGSGPSNVFRLCVVRVSVTVQEVAR